MHFNPYGGSGAQVAAALVNLSEPDAVLATLRDHGMAVVSMSPDEALAIMAWRERLRSVFAESDVDVRIDLLNRLLADSASAPYISRHDGRPPHLHYHVADGSVVDRVRAYTAGGLAHAVCEDSGRAGVCDRPGCAVVFVDTSRNGRRRFCSTRCATRVYVADHRQRQAG
ncbi:CGNR zinc finger domain-containing protein [Kutzneria sp. NPDC052558]|uniref:CGNR zinc finger domain-containing protein n=1 Tax=Kutzneria sp. NPDC052558 TaxID=3364121 RepID=UPI0037C9DD07